MVELLFLNNRYFLHRVQNFMLQMQHNKKTGIFYLLNEYGDMTAEEYNQLMNKGRDTVNPGTAIGNDAATTSDVRPPRSNNNVKKAWTPSRDNDKLSGVEVVEALAKTAQEYQNYLSRKSASASRRRERESNDASFSKATSGSPKSPLGGGSRDMHQFLIDDLEEQRQQFMEGITSQPKLVTPPRKKEKEEVVKVAPKKESTGHAVTAELVVDPPPRSTDDEEKTVSNNFDDDYSTAPRVKPPPKVQAMGTSQSYGEKDAPRQRPGTLESKFFQTVKGTPSNRSFFSGIGTQFVGISSNKRLVRWEPGMDG